MSDHTPSGIYAIRSKRSGKMYIGSAINIRRRWKAHRHILLKGQHPNPRLRGAFDKCGRVLDAFEFVVLEHCPVERLTAREQHYIDTLKPAYNQRMVAKSNLGWKQSDEIKARAYSPELKAQRIAAFRATWEARRADPAFQEAAKAKRDASQQRARAKAKEERHMEAAKDPRTPSQKMSEARKAYLARPGVRAAVAEKTRASWAAGRPYQGEP